MTDRNSGTIKLLPEEGAEAPTIAIGVVPHLVEI